MKRRLFAAFVNLLFVFLFVLFFGQTVWGAEYHITTGTELYNTLRQAGQNGEDDVIYLAAGIYDRRLPDGRMIAGFDYGSLEGRSITLMGEPGTNAYNVVIDGHNNFYCLNMTDHSLPAEASYDPAFARPRVVISGITFQNGRYEYGPGGLQIGTYGFDIAVQNCRILNNTSNGGRGAGIGAYGYRVVLENNVILNNVLNQRLTNEGPECRGAGVFTWNTHDAVIRNNIVANNVAVGENSTGGGFYLCISCYSTANIINNTIAYNEAYHGGGIYFGTMPASTANLYNNIIYMNTAASRDDSGDLYFWEDPRIAPSWQQNVYAYNNNFSQALGVLRGEGNNRNVDPMFANHLAGDFHLRTGSPMIDQGQSSVPNPPGLPGIDFENDARVIGTAPDIGADEYSGMTTPSPIRPRPTIKAWSKDLPMIAKRLTELELSVSLDGYGRKGEAEWWLVYISPKGKKYLTKDGWSEEEAPWYQGPIEDVKSKSFPGPELSSKGIHFFWFGVDTKVNGKMTPDEMVSDSVTIYVVDEEEEE